ncbi:DUF6683 family protein [Rubrivivax gelatinosus]|uniref:DUF6683 family protein n=1 Tax=Rubrivivax gelatinosus TaxID=28068 RepID=UPI001F5BFF13|nr:DUF6683 family protein [Rubrivivax gelatinosus]
MHPFVPGPGTAFVELGLVGRFDAVLRARRGADPHPAYTGTPLMITGGVLNQQLLQASVPGARPAADSGFPPLVEQSRRILAALPQLRVATAPARQDTYEQLAILGMFMATTRMALDRQPDRVAVANLKQAAKRYLEQFLAVDAERVQLGPEGLRLN